MRQVRSGFWVALVIALLVTGYAYWDFFEARRVRARVDAVATSGAPMRMTTGKRLTGGAADADRYYRAASILGSGASSPADVQADARIRHAFAENDWTPEMTALLRDRVNERAEALALIDRAAALPFEGFETGWRYGYGVTGLVILERLSAWRAVERALMGDADGAFDSLYSEVRLERATQRVPSFVGLAFVTARAKPSDAARARLAQALDEIDRDDRLQRSFEQLRALRLESAAVGRPAGLTAPLLNHMFTTELDTFADLIAAAGRPAADRAGAVVAVGRWPVGFMSRDKARAALEQMTKSTQSEIDRIRCARRLVAREMVNCLR